MLPEEWKWLDDLPSEWVVPQELQTPTNSPSINLALKILSSGIVGNNLIELVGAFVAASAGFSMWFASEAKLKVKSSKDLARLSMMNHEQAHRVYDAWLPYLVAFESSGGLVESYGDQKLNLIDALVTAVSQLSETKLSEW